MILNQQVPSLLKDIRFWILFFFIIRLYGITFPPLEVGHNWRQTDGMMIARNFYEKDSNIFFPTVDLAGDKSGIVGCEFPILNYLVYIVSVIFGYQHWYGRIIVLLFSCIGVFFFHRLIRKYFGELPAFNGSIILLVSLWFSYSRKNVPDVFAASLCITSVYFAFSYFDKGTLLDLFLFFITGLLGCLSKILAATILTILVIPFLDKKIHWKRKLILSLFSFLILAAVFYWYFIWAPYLNTFGFGDHFFLGMTWSEGMERIMLELPQVLNRIYLTPLKYTGFIAFILGILLMIRNKAYMPLLVFIIPFISFLILLTKTGSSIISDRYYIITAIPCMAFAAGYAIAQIKHQRWMIIALIIISIEGIADQSYDFKIRQPYKSLGDLEAIMDQVSSRNELIAINAYEIHNPTAMYFAHRRGWVTPNEKLSNAEYINDIKNRGCQFIVIAKESYGDIQLNYPIVHESQYFKIYSLK